MPTTFHHRLTAALDASQMAGAHALPLHSAIRRAMRESNMRGAPFASAAQLANAVRGFAPHFAAAAERFAA